ncbi:MAG: sensor histidine kinase [Flavobacteriales bacterium]|nr:sensor histidine kinase [Flavobacteriales bacterium]
MLRTLHPHRMRWPLAAALLATLFIAYGISLVSRSRELQARIGQEVRLLEELNGISDDLHQLSLVHRADMGSQRYNWPRRLGDLRERVRAASERYQESPGMADLPQAIAPALHQADSLHALARSSAGPSRDTNMAEAVFQIMIARAKKAVDRTTSEVHEQGLSAHTATLSDRWNEAQVLLVTACLLAVLMAWLVGVRDKLLLVSRLKAEQLSIAKSNLERTNHELRETMLSKEEKEVMIKEIHHRVKNNLQIVKSLIRFQMDQVKDAHTQELFNECVNRVSAMALVHEQTYLSKDLSNIPVDSYLDHLIRDLVYAYSVNVRLNMDIDISVKTLSVDALVPLGLLINEVISNSFKYAFPERESGTIFFHLHGSESEGLRMRIGDDGVGLKSRDGFHRPNSLGMDLIHTLAGQLDADIHLLDGPGTQYELLSHKLSKRKVA